MKTLDLTKKKPEAAAKALYQWCRKQSEELGQKPDKEVALWSPKESEEHGCGKAWRVMWESGPFEWGVSLSLGGSYLAPEMDYSYTQEPEVLMLDAEHFTAEPYYSFDIGFYPIHQTTREEAMTTKTDEIVVKKSPGEGYKKDDRRSKTYFRKVSYQFSMMDDYEEKHRSSWDRELSWDEAQLGCAGYLCDYIKDAFPKQEGIKVEVSGPSRPYSKNENWQGYVSFTLYAKRPSLIPATDVVFATVEETYGNIPYIIREALVAGLKEQEKTRKKSSIIRDADTLIEWMTSKARKEARTTMRWEQRLAGLVAEADAEAKYQLQLLTQDLLKDGIQDESGKEWDERSIKAACKLAEKHLGSMAPSRLPGMHQGKKVNADDIEWNDE